MPTATGFTSSSIRPGARRWIVRVTVKGQKNRAGKPLRTDFGLGGVDLVPLQEARAQALEYRRLARAGLDPRTNAPRAVPTFEAVARQVHKDRLSTWKNPKQQEQWINTLSTHAFPRIGRMPVSAIGQPEVLSCLSPIWTEKPETARRVAQRIRKVLDVARAQGHRDTENPVTAIHEAGVLPKIRKAPEHHKAMHWRDLPAFYADLSGRDAMAAKALMLTCLTALRTSEVLEARWEEFDLEGRLWTIPGARMKAGKPHRVPLTDEMLGIIEPLRAMKSEVVFEGQKRHRPLSNMAMLMLLRRMGAEDVTVHGFRSTFRDWVSEATEVPREIAEMCMAHDVGTAVERAYARSDLLDRRRALMERWCGFVAGRDGMVVRLPGTG